MELKQLLYFVTVVQEGNISKAAKKLHLSQPPLSTQLKNLESELNCTLFDRGSRQILLTKPGEILYERALTMLEFSRITTREITDSQHETKGTLRLGVISSVGSTLLNEWLIGFHQAYPNICFEIFEGNTYEQIEKLQNHMIEMAIVRTPFSTDSLDCTFLKSEDMIAVGNKKFFGNGTNNHNENDSTKASTITLIDLAGKPLILYRRWTQILEKQFQDAGMNVQIFCINDDARTTLCWADAGLGIGIVPASAISLIKGRDTICKTITDADLASSICIISNPGAYKSSLAKIFTSYLLSLTSRSMDTKSMPECMNGAALPR